MNKLKLFFMIFGVILITIALYSLCNYYNLDYIHFKNTHEIIEQYNKLNSEILFRVDGILQIPSISLELPVLKICNDETLNKGCCIYYKDDECIIICGHNTSSMFKKIRKLKTNDYIYLNNMKYKVIKHEIIDEDQVNLMINTSYDLTLFTCTYDSNRRYTIRCNQVIE